MDDQAALYEKLIESSLAHFDYSNALFLSERLVACYPESPRATYFQGKSYFLKNLKHAAYRVLEGQSYAPSRFLFAKCCLELDFLQEGEQALRYVLESVARAKTRTSGDEMETDDGMADEGLAMEHVYCLLGKICRRAGKKEEATLSFMRALELSPFLWDAYQELCDLRTAPESELVFGARTAPTLIPRPAAPANPNPSKKAQSRKRNRDGERKPESGPTSDADDATDTQPQRKKRATSAGDAILHDFQLLGAAYRHLTRYESREALQAFAGVSEAHLKTGWVMTQMARCFYEIARYPEAAKHFREARDLEPWRLDGLDLFGSCLWHLREEVELAFLAKDMEANDRLAPQTWCIVGNLYSLRQEHELAIKCFSRAIQLDPYYYYAYTLTGFEYKMKEEFEKSVDYFQKSIRIEPGPFNAWFGMGEIFFQQENYRTAQFHYDKAIKINPRNPIIQYHLGVILQKLEHPEKAISAFEKAVKLDEKNPLYRFRLAYALVQEKQYEKALHLLAPLEGFTQSESNVFLLIGRIHKALGNKSKALLAYTKARDHRGSRCDVINEAVESLYAQTEEGMGNDDLAGMFHME